MNVFLDTSVLVASCWKGHQHYSQALPILQRIAGKRDKGFISAHSIAEMYSALTRLPVVPRIHPTDAERIIAENILPLFQTVSLNERDYVEALKTVAGGGWPGGKIYDALLLRCAAKCKADRIYTFNLSDFKMLAPLALRTLISAPD